MATPEEKLQCSVAELSVTENEAASSSQDSKVTSAPAAAASTSVHDPNAVLFVQQMPAATVDPQQQPHDAQATLAQEGLQTTVAVVDSSQKPEDTQSEPAVRRSLWHRPQIGVWSEIQDVALKLIATLKWSDDWLFSSKRSTEASASYVCLRIDSMQLLHDLLIGHFDDEGMDFQKIINTGLLCVLTCYQKMPKTSCPCLEALAMAFLQRMTQDFADWATLEVYERPEERPAGLIETAYIWDILGECITLPDAWLQDVIQLS